MVLQTVVVSGSVFATFQPFIWLSIALAVLLAFISKYIYRLTLHPLARFPGPKLAAATNLYGAYIDLGTSKSYTKSFPALHEKYGPTPPHLSPPSTTNLRQGLSFEYGPTSYTSMTLTYTTSKPLIWLNARFAKYRM